MPCVWGLRQERREARCDYNRACCNALYLTPVLVKTDCPSMK